MASDRRAALVDAAIELVLEQRFQDLLACVDTRSITERAGVTTGSFFHHFRNRAEFTQAVADRFRELWDRSAAALVDDLEALAGGTGGDVRSVAQDDWDKVAAGAVEGTLQHLLWAARDQPLVVDGSDTAGDVLRGAYRHLLESALPSFRRVLAALDREPIPPFDLADIAVALTALADGIQMRQAVQPDVVRPTLFADLAAGVLASTTRPAGDRHPAIELADIEAGLRIEDRARADDGATRRSIAAAAAALFDAGSLGDVRLADVADAAGVPVGVVERHFGSVAEVAAAGWARFVPDLEAIATRPLTATDGPVRRIERVLVAVIDLGRRHPAALEGLVLSTTPRGGERPGRGALAEEVPLAELVAPLVRELRGRGLLRRRIDSDALARTIVQLVLARVLAGPGDPHERIIDETLGLVLDGALDGGGAG